MTELRGWLDASILLIEARAERSEARGWFNEAELARARALAFRDVREHLDRPESLLVVLAPPPDSQVDAVTADGGDGLVDSWELSEDFHGGRIITAYDEGVCIDEAFADASSREFTDIESDALKVLAAIASHRRYAAEADGAE